MSEAEKKGKSKVAETPAESRVVIVRRSADGLAQDIVVGPHRMRADEPAPVGTDSGATPHQLLAAALGACTSMTLTVYAQRKQWPLESVTVVLTHSRIDAGDCNECDTKEGMIDRIERAIELGGPLTPEQRTRLLEIADKCPVHKTLQSEVNIRTRLVE